MNYNYRKKRRMPKLDPLTQTIWYHATTLNAYRAIKEFGVQANFNKGNELDFGFGFYLTSSLEKAAEFILKLKDETEKLGEQDSTEYLPVVIEFELPFNLKEADAGNYRLKIFKPEDNDFYDFVLHNRLHNVYGENHHNFDMVYGDMANSNPLRLIIDYRVGNLTKEQVIGMFGKYSDFNQLSVHSQEICDKLRITNVYDAETKEELNLDGQY